MKRNGKLTLPIVLGVISLLAISVSTSPTSNLAVKAQGQNQPSSPETSQQVQQKLVELSEKFRGLVNSSGANSLSPLPSWSNSVAQTWLIPPFGQ